MHHSFPTDASLTRAASPAVARCDRDMVPGGLVSTLLYWDSGRRMETTILGFRVYAGGYTGIMERTWKLLYWDLGSGFHRDNGKNGNHYRDYGKEH